MNKRQFLDLVAIIAKMDRRRLRRFVANLADTLKCRIASLTRRSLEDYIASKFTLSATVFSSLLALIIALVLIQRSTLILKSHPLNELLLSSSFDPWAGKFGFLPFIASTLWVTALAMVLSVPPSLLMAIYLAEYAPKKIRGIVKPMIDLLAGIPSVVFGLWGVLVVVPLVRDYLAPMVGTSTTGYTVLTGGIVLSIMVCPIMISISEEVIRAVPSHVREASMALGATKWQTIKHAVARSAFPGIAAAVMLGFGRAFGETMAVLMVTGGTMRTPAPTSLFSSAYPLPALIAGQYGELLTIPLFESGLMFAALLLLVIVLVFSIAAAIMLARIKRGYAIG